MHEGVPVCGVYVLANTSACEGHGQSLEVELQMIVSCLISSKFSPVEEKKVDLTIELTSPALNLMFLRMLSRPG